MSLETINDTKARLESLPQAERDRVIRELADATRHLKWIPNVGAQLDAYNSEADVLLFGGEPGGSKTDLILGLAFNKHKRSLIMRRQYTDLDSIIDRAIAINGSKNGYNGSPPPSLKVGEKTIQFGAAKSDDDVEQFMGRARDLLGLDEATQFTENQVRFLMGWVRSEDKNQRCRVVMATNPPLSSKGMWVIKMFAPWLDDTYHDPAKPGELRWVITTEDGDVWVDGPGLYPARGKMVRATSRSYIPSRLADNPFYSNGNYEATLDALPEHIRSILMGGFKASFKDAPNQVIPTLWIRDAQQRWRDNQRPPQGVPMCAIAADCSGGGDDPLVLSPRYDNWFDKLIETPGKNIPKDAIGSFTVTQILKNRKDDAQITLDMGGGYGSSAYEILSKNELPVNAYKGNMKTVRRTKDRQLKYFNVRAEAAWRLREELDPDQAGGATICLPDDPVLLSDLCALTLDMEYEGIKVKSKEEVNEQLGRSTNRGDAVMMSWYFGPRALTDIDSWDKGKHRFPKVLMGRRH